MNVIVDLSTVKFNGPTKEFEIRSDTGNPVIRVFCSNCGSRLASKAPVSFAGKLIVPTGSMQEMGKLPVSAEVFTSSRWPTVAPFPNAKQYEGMPY